MKKFFCVVTLALICVFFISCGEKDAFAGRWECKGALETIVYSFSGDGTGTFTAMYTGDITDSGTIEYTVFTENGIDLISITETGGFFGPETTVYNYSFSDGTLILETSGDRLEFIKQ